jgi:hypothetical protein
VDANRCAFCHRVLDAHSATASMHITRFDAYHPLRCTPHAATGV